MGEGRSFAQPVLLDRTHDTSQFACEHESLILWLQQRAYRNHMSGGTRTWVVLNNESRVIAYYASAASSVLHSQTRGRIRRNQPDPIPAIILSRLAVDLNYRNQGLGAGLLKHFLLKSLEVANMIGVRAAIVYAIDQRAREFYEHFDFVSSPLDENLLMLVLSDIAPVG